MRRRPLRALVLVLASVLPLVHAPRAFADAGVGGEQAPVVSFRSEDPHATLQRVTSWGRRHIKTVEDVCTAPCVHPLVPGSAYLVGGPGIVRSNWFRSPERGRLELSAKTGASWPYPIALGVFVAGWGTGIGGVPLQLGNASERRAGEVLFVTGGGVAAAALALALPRTRLTFGGGSVALALTPAGVVF